MKRTQHPDYFLLVLAVLLLLIGLIFLNSASAVMGYNNFKDPFYYLKHQLISGFLPGLLLFLIFYRLELKTLQKAANILLLLGVLLLAAVFVPGLGMKHSEAQRWINLGFFAFQPVEIFKLFFIIFLAHFFTRRERKTNDIYMTVIPFIFILVFVSFLIIKQPNASATVITFLISLTMFFIAGGSIFYLVGFLTIGLVGLLALIWTAPYQLNRLITLFNPNVDPQGISYHLQQALIAIGSGGIFGVGLGYSRQKFFYLPESFGDSIFAVIAEEMGFVLTSLIIVLFFLLVWRGLKIAKNTSDSFLRLLAVGIISWIGFQTIVNIGAMVGILPLTGLPLPFISYGGSALAANLGAMGILLNISKNTS